jgi:2-iminoacetate synthase ThiH
VSLLVDRAIVAAGLGEIAAARRDGDLDRVRALASCLDAAELLALGGLADRVRAEEVGGVVRVYANLAAESADDVVLVRGAEGTLTLRKVAIARITGPFRARVRLDWADTGLELAQVALGFGASELVGPIANRRGLPIAADLRTKVKGAGLVSVQALKQKELEALIARTGRTALFVGVGVDAPAERHAMPEPEAPHAR